MHNQSKYCIHATEHINVSVIHFFLKNEQLHRIDQNDCENDVLPLTNIHLTNTNLHSFDRLASHL